MISVLQLGTIDYATGLRLQQRLVDLRKEGRIGDVLLLLEHSPVITLGRNARQKNIVASPELLAQRGVEVFECDRGGDVTFHGPGQLVGYPIFDLRGIATPDGKRKTLGAIEYVRRLEEVLIRTCADFGIPAARICGLTGVWTNPKARGQVIARAASRETCCPHQQAKIAAIGVHISRAVTSHGFALNVNTDLDYFNLIIPCGIATRPVTSMAKELNRQLSLQDVAHSISRNFGMVFESQMLWLDSLDALLGRICGSAVKASRATAPAAQRRRYVLGIRRDRTEPSALAWMTPPHGQKAKSKDVLPGPHQPPGANQRTYTIPDHRLEKLDISIRQVRKGGKVSYEVTGDLSAPVPPIRESKYLSKKQCIEIYRWMLLNRKMEAALENLYKQGKVVGGVYFGLGQEACSCASAYALRKDDWLGPMIRNQGSTLVRGFSPRDIMMQYMAKAGSPTRGRDASSHFGDIKDAQRGFSHLDPGRPDSRCSPAWPWARVCRDATSPS